MTPAELQTFLHRNIPASAALQFSVTEADPGRTALIAPIAANCNHHHTVFGGSIVMLATLCGWSLVHLNYPEYHGKIVIQESHIRYLKPARGDLTAVCEKTDPEAWAQCSAMLAARGKGKIHITCTLFSNDIKVAEFEGKYVVLAE
ncbi:thioesterase domain-containing protein [Neisseria montereyensis]|uniref:Thioesterase domain-containing protein n=1 Tax=Neisseria montereyensis TaxID=2973938 RepID=A0ABT2FDK3_9NEIS|nr:thioesterase domain-containing protein [Neisseria montereyensis]MCS4534289.1 thioesterase domain-containing protein [Neisseria montereyensis]